jgi:putative endonuclease
MPGSRRVGSEAEDQAAEYLIEQGYTIVTRRWVAKGGELDLVALDGETLVFVEVKSRSGRWYAPEAAIDDVKVKHFIEAVERYCHATEQEGRPVRYDVIAIDDKGLRHYVDAFRAS